MTRRASTFEGKRRTPCNAIRAHCRWCCGGENPKSCVSVGCALYDLRACKPSEASSTPLRAIRARCLECAGSPDAVRECAAYRDHSEVQTACALWPHRLGKRNVSEQYRLERAEQAKAQKREPGPGGKFLPMKDASEE